MIKFLGTGIVLAAGAALFAGLIILNALLGAGVGWVVGWFFSDTILGIFAALGVKGFAMWQMGAFLGFVGSFFRSTSTK